MSEREPRSLWPELGLSLLFWVFKATKQLKKNEVKRETRKIQKVKLLFNNKMGSDVDIIRYLFYFGETF